jgi:hypothetical protein
VSLPLEFRFWVRLFTEEDAKAGMQSVKQIAGPHTIELYAPPALQYRVKTKEAWSDWTDVPYVREGDSPSVGAA